MIACDIVVQVSPEAFDPVMIGTVGWKVARSLAHGDGLINLEINIEKPGGATIVLNFHRSSSESDKLLEWLTVPIDEVKEQGESLLQELPGVMSEA